MIDRFNFSFMRADREMVNHSPFHVKRANQPYRHWHCRTIGFTQKAIEKEPLLRLVSDAQ